MRSYRKFTPSPSTLLPILGDRHPSIIILLSYLLFSPLYFHLLFLILLLILTLSLPPSSSLSRLCYSPFTSILFYFPYPLFCIPLFSFSPPSFLVLFRPFPFLPLSLLFYLFSFISPLPHLSYSLHSLILSLHHSFLYILHPPLSFPLHFLFISCSILHNRLYSILQHTIEYYYTTIHCNTLHYTVLQYDILTDFI